MAQGMVPLYGFYLEPLPAGIAGDATWGRAFVDLRGTTLMSRRQIELNRRVRLSTAAAEALGAGLVEFWYLREIVCERELETRREKTIRDIVPVWRGPITQGSE